jgi:probable HAF family extracellular repeat protein
MKTTGRGAWIGLATAVAIVTAVGNSMGAEGSVRYSLRKLPVREGCAVSALWHGLDERGNAVAQMSCDEWASARGIVWAGGIVTELPSLGGPNATPYGLMPDGVVVGMAETPEPYDETSFVSRAVVWEHGTPRPLKTLGGLQSSAMAINARGMVVGACQPLGASDKLGRRPLRACTWSAGNVRELGDLGGPESAAYDVNRKGWIAGSATTATELPSGAGFEEHAYVWNGRSMRDLGTLGGPFSLAWALNDRGDVVGQSLTANVWTAGERPVHAFVWRRGAMKDLGTLGGPLSTALDVNAGGDIVGWSRLTEPIANIFDHGVLWRGDVLIDLNDVLDDPRGCEVTGATAINDRGQILANARCGEVDRVVLLEPL